MSDSTPASLAAPSTFVFAEGREPHAARAREILKAHPASVNSQGATRGARS